MKQTLVALMIALFTTPVSADVTYTQETRSLHVTGETTDWQVIQVYAAFRDHQVDTVFLSGPGGTLDAGMSIGRMFRKYGVRVVVLSETMCVSACAIAALGGEELDVDGTLLFHRPYTLGVPSGVTVEEIGAYMAGVYLSLALYTVEMGYPISFVSYVGKHSSPCLFMNIGVPPKGDPLDAFTPDYKIVDGCGNATQGR